eukprot:CAMPEP_0175055070 /NCGR_PEP_ID=MMETSP0052_2-20121109/9865_1 /TAXON_ID=51329 ORGANISM="Polytomella parva, Strain SAG 63-3" /NCGR_SAMPLE_ID=MMETSP0052_2 /ASSEMBLY_ACC=CAM_ASM_000194 /LENGTH=521 /DNA_ID=CAMNT_0016319853 /DNA_START=21 /DNA_END=1583 /DNA_ORIENTATION=-
MRDKQMEVDQRQKDLENRLGSSIGPQVGLVIEGGVLRKLLTASLAGQLADLCCSCKCVVACRVTPMQKALVVKLVQIKRKAIILGIGDGANDVGMIQAAHIGCGISGREGRAAVLASDFAFAQFRYVARLLLFHGRSMCLKNMEVVWYAFYKNWVYNAPLLYFGFLSGFSTQPLFTTGMISTFNLIWTSAPTVAFAVFEQDLRQQTVLSHPELYRESLFFGRRRFMHNMLMWWMLACWHSLVIFFAPTYSQAYQPNSTGRTDDLIFIGSSIFTSIVVIANLRVAIRSSHFTWVNIFFITVSIVCYFPFLLGYSEVWTFKPMTSVSDVVGIGMEYMSHARYWLASIFLTPAMALLPDLAIDFFRRRYWPTMTHVYQEWESLWLTDDDPEMDPDFDVAAHQRPSTVHVDEDEHEDNHEHKYEHKREKGVAGGKDLESMTMAQNPLLSNGHSMPFRSNASTRASSSPSPSPRIVRPLRRGKGGEEEAEEKEEEGKGKGKGKGEEVETRDKPTLLEGSRDYGDAD